MARGRSRFDQALGFARQLASIDRRAREGTEHYFDCVYSPIRARLSAHFGERLGQARVLDFGCGYTFPIVLFLAEDVAEAVGLDVSPSVGDGWWRTVDSRGGRRVARRMPGLRELLYGTLRYWDGKRSVQHAERRGRVVAAPRIIQYDGAVLPFPDASFDAIVSNAVLQELPGPLERFAEEMARVLRPGGCVDLEWHNFYSMFGNYRAREQSLANPWGHLRPDGDYDPSLNRQKPERVLEAFSASFVDVKIQAHDVNHRIQGVDPEYQPEGLEYLTPALAAEFSEYSPELLTTRGYILTGRRR